MDSPKEVKQPENVSSSSRQASNSLDRLRAVIGGKLSQFERLIEDQPDLQTITLVIKLDRRGRPRTVLVRTETKSELSS